MGSRLRAHRPRVKLPARANRNSQSVDVSRET